MQHNMIGGCKTSTKRMCPIDFNLIEFFISSYSTFLIKAFCNYIVYHHLFVHVFLELDLSTQIYISNSVISYLSNLDFEVLICV